MAECFAEKLRLDKCDREQCVVHLADLGTGNGTVFTFKKVCDLTVSENIVML